METLTVGEFKSRFSEVLEILKRGGEVLVTYGKKKEVVGRFVPPIKEKKKEKRKLGGLKGTYKWVGDGKITGKELEEMLS